jgi:hypothetical protein
VRKIKIILIGFIVSWAAASHVQARPPLAFENPVSVASDPQFGNQRKVLHRLVQKNGQRGRNDLCVIGQNDGKGTRADTAWVIWKQDHSIILWEPGQTTYLTDGDQLWLSRRYLYVPRDVSADPDETTNYLMTPAWVRSVRYACNKLGQHFLIIKR